MKITLDAGTRKVLIIDNEAISRNAERGAGICQPVVTVAEVDEAGMVLSLTRGLTVDVQGITEFEYSQHAFLFVIDRIPYRGAWVTKAKVVIDDGTDAATAATEDTPNRPTRPSRPARATTPVTEEATA